MTHIFIAAADLHALQIRDIFWEYLQWVNGEIYTAKLCQIQRVADATSPRLN